MANNINDNYFFRVDKNDKYSKFSKDEIAYLINEVLKFNLEYRDKLELPTKFSFGTEIEYDNYREREIYRELKKKYKNWSSTIDLTVIKGGEVVSPVLHNTKECWQELKGVCELLKQKGVAITDAVGGHIHAGLPVIGSNISYWLKFLKVYIIYESILYRFGFGEFLNGRNVIKLNAYPSADEQYYKLNYLEADEDLLALKEQKDLLNINKTILERYRKNGYFNSFQLYYDFPNNIDEFDDNIDNSMEFRFFNGTVEEVIWQNNINAIGSLLLAPSRDLIDEEYLDYQLNYCRTSSRFGYINYHAIDINKVLELVDMIFTNNLDKSYFLRQYIKDYGVVLPHNDSRLIKSRQFWN